MIAVGAIDVISNDLTYFVDACGDGGPTKRIIEGGVDAIAVDKAVGAASGRVTTDDLTGVIYAKSINIAQPLEGRAA